MKQSSHEFLTAFVLFITPDQTMRVQTGLKGEAVGGNNLFLGRRQTVINEKKKAGGLECGERDEGAVGRRVIGRVML